MELYGFITEDTSDHKPIFININGSLKYNINWNFIEKKLNKYESTLLIWIILNYYINLYLIKY